MSNGMGAVKRVAVHGTGRGLVPSAGQWTSGSRRTVAPGPIIEAWDEIPAAGEAAIESKRFANKTQ